MISRIRRRAAVVLMVVGLALGIPLGVMASHQFTDVPDVNPFHDDIDALVSAGITFGCGGSNFCPSNFVTREQMAAFMNRLGSLDGTTAPSVNAAAIDGLDSTAFHRYGANAPQNSLMTGAFVVGGLRAAGADTWKPTALVYQTPLSAAATPHVIPVGGPVPAGCAGTASAPDAAPGHVCAFLQATSNVGTTNIPVSTRFGALLQSFSTADGNWFAYGTWASRSLTGAAVAPSDEVLIFGELGVAQ